MDLQGSVRVDDKTYIWTGENNFPSLPEYFAANLTSIQITPTRTIFIMQAGPMNVTITYLSPIEVRNPVSHQLFSIPEPCVSAVRLETTVIAFLLRFLRSNLARRPPSRR